MFHSLNQNYTDYLLFQPYNTCRAVGYILGYVYFTPLSILSPPSSKNVCFYKLLVGNLTCICLSSDYAKALRQIMFNTVAFG